MYNFVYILMPCYPNNMQYMFVACSFVCLFTCSQDFDIFRVVPFGAILCVF